MVHLMIPFLTSYPRWKHLENAGSAMATCKGPRRKTHDQSTSSIPFNKDIRGYRAVPSIYSPVEAGPPAAARYTTSNVGHIPKKDVHVPKFSADDLDTLNSDEEGSLGGL